MSMTLVWQILLAVAAAVFTTLGPVVTSYLVAHLKASKNTVLSQQLSTLVGLAGTMALDALQSVAGHNPTVTIKNASVQKAIAALAGPFSTLALAFNLTPEHIASMVNGELTKLLGVATNADGTVVTAEPAPSPGSSNANGTGGITKASFEVWDNCRIDPLTQRVGSTRGFDYRGKATVRPGGAFARLMSWHRVAVAAFALAIIAPVVGCAATESTLAADAQIALSTLSATLTSYEATTGANGTTINEVQSYITQAQTIITDYQTGVTSSFDSTSVAALIEDGLNIFETIQTSSKATSTPSPATLAFDNSVAASENALNKFKSD